jgi:hypothetical protein
MLGNIYIHIDASVTDANFGNVRVAMTKIREGEYRLFNDIVFTPPAGSSLIDNICTIAELLNHPNAQFITPPNQTFRKLAQRINHFILRHNVAADQRKHTPLNQLFLSIPYAKACVMWFNQTAAQTSRFSYEALIRSFNQYLLNIGQIEGCDLLELERHVDDFQGLCLYTPDEFRRIAEYFNEIRAIKTFLQRMGGQEGNLDQIDRSLKNCPDTTTIKQRCTALITEIDQAERQFHNSTSWNYLRGLARGLQARLTDQLCPALKVARELNIHEQIHSRLGRTMESIYNEVFVKYTREFNTALALRNRLDPEHLAELEAAINKTKKAFAAWVVKHCEVHCKTLAFPPDLEWITQQLKTHAPAEAECIQRLEALVAFKQMFTNLNKRIFSDKELQNFRPIPGEPARPALDRLRDTLNQEMNALQRCFEQLFGYTNQMMNMRDELVRQYQEVIDKNTKAHTFCKDFAAKLQEMEQESNVLTLMQKARTVLEGCSLGAVERQFLTSEEIQHVEDCRFTYHQAYVKCLLSKISYDNFSLCAEFHRTIENYTTLYRERIREEEMRTLHSYSTILEELKKAFDVNSKLYLPARADKQPRFCFLSLDDLIQYACEYASHLKAVNEMYARHFPHFPNPWKEELEKLEVMLIAETQNRHAMGLNLIFDHLIYNFKYNHTKTSPHDQLSALCDAHDAHIHYMSHSLSSHEKHKTVAAYNAARIEYQKKWIAWVKQYVQAQLPKVRAAVGSEQIDAELLKFIQYHESNVRKFDAETYTTLLPLIEIFVPGVTEQWQPSLIGYAKYEAMFIKHAITRCGWELKIVSELPLADRSDKTIYLQQVRGSNRLCHVHPLTGIWMIQPVKPNHPEDIVNFIKITKLRLQQEQEYKELLVANRPSLEIYRKRDLFIDAHKHQLSTRCNKEVIVVYDEVCQKFLVLFNFDKVLQYNTINSMLVEYGNARHNVLQLESLAELDHHYFRQVDQAELQKMSAQYRLSKKAYEKLSPLSEIKVPEMPKDLARTNLQWLLDIFDTINFTDPRKPGYIHPNTIRDDNPQYILRVDTVRSSLATLVKCVNSTPKGNYSAIPSQEAAKAKWYHNFEALMRNAILILRNRYDMMPQHQKAAEMFAIQGLVLEFAKTTGHCGGRWISEANLLYGIVSGRLDVLFEGDLHAIMHKIIDILKIGTIEEMAREGLGQPGYDLSHGNLFIMRVLHKAGIAIPQAEIALYDDVYAHMGAKGKYRTAEDAFDGFNKKATCHQALRNIHEELNKRIITEKGIIIYNALRESMKKEAAVKRLLVPLQAEHAKQIKKLEERKKAEAALTAEETTLLTELSNACKNAMQRIALLRDLPKMQRIRTLLQNKPTSAINFEHVWRLAEFKQLLEKEKREHPLTPAEIEKVKRWIAKEEQSKKTIELSEEEIKFLNDLSDQKENQLSEAGVIHWVNKKTAKPPFAFPPFFEKFNLLVTPYAKQIDNLKEQQADEVHALLDEEAVKMGLLRKENRVMKAPDSEDTVVQEVTQMTIKGTLHLMGSSNLTEKW